MSGRTLLVIAKDPYAVPAKTRLAGALGSRAATKLAAAMLEDTIVAASAATADRRVLVLDDGNAGGRGTTGLPWPERIAEPDRTGWLVRGQRSGGLEHRLLGAFEGAAGSGPAFLIGMDTPQITPELIDAGLDALADPKAVSIGPALDGGYWGIGMTGVVPEVFLDVPMSTADTFAVTAGRIESSGLKPVVLPELGDVDTLDDLERVIPACAPESRLPCAYAALQQAETIRAPRSD